MADPSIPRFAEPGSYIRYFGTSLVEGSDKVDKFRFVRLQETEKPLNYPFTFGSLGVDAVGDPVTFSDLEPGLVHIYQVFLGVAPGVRIRVSHPQDVRVLKWDENIAQISEDLTAVLNHGLSPWENPSYAFWIRPSKQFPSLTPQNTTAEMVPGGKSIKPRIIFLGAMFIFKEIREDEAVFDMLVKKKIPSRPIRFGRSLREIPT